MKKRKILLMNKDKVTASYIESSDDTDATYDLVSQEDHYLPYGFYDMATWIDQRQAAKHQKHIKQLMIKCGCDTLPGFIDMTRCLSLNDTFWVKPEDSSDTWDKVSLYKNPFDEAIAHFAFDGAGLYSGAISPTSPELTTSGSFSKCWIRENDKIYLIKRGSEGAINLGFEPYSEVLSHQILNKLGYVHVPYEIVTYRSKLASKCPLYTDENTGFVPAARLLDPRKRPQSKDLLTLASENGCEKQFRQMCVFDAISVNADRHTGNWGFLVDNDTGRIKGFMPLFDHNMALFPGAMEGDTFEYHFEFSRPQFGGNFISLANEMITPEIKADIRKLLEFDFEPIKGFPEWKISWTKNLVIHQIQNIL